jgi:ribosomal protein S18 acetylase RimI-like enzyme
MNRVKAFMQFKNYTSKIVVENVGFVTLQRRIKKNSDTCAVYEIYVDKKIRNKGYGTALMRLAQKYVKKNHPQVRNLIVRCDIDAETFYFKNGYTCCPRNEHVMRKRIK